MHMHRTLVLFLLMVFSATSSILAWRTHHLYTAGYNGAISEFRVDSSGRIYGPQASVTHHRSGKSVSWLEFSKRVVYSVDEADPGRVYVHTRNLEQLGSVSSGGDEPVSLERGRGPSRNMLFVANYFGGSASVLDIQRDGSLSGHHLSTNTFHFTRTGAGPGPVPDRQNQSYAHQVRVSPDGRFVYICDLGADQIHRLRIHPNHTVTLDGITRTPPGSGPRHLVLYKSHAYLAAELSNTVHSFTRNIKTGHLTPLSPPLNVIPSSQTNSTGLTTAEIHISPDGKFVYVSSRGNKHQDHIAIYARAKNGLLTFKHWVPTFGRNPRHFSLSHDRHASLLAVANQKSGNVVVFKRNRKSGVLTPTDKISGLPQVAFSGFAPY